VVQQLNKKGFSLIELMVSMVLLSILLLGIYKLTMRTTRAAAAGTAMSNLTRQMSSLTGYLRKSIKSMGYNPLMSFYPICTGTSDPITACAPNTWTNPVLPIHSQRIGLNYVNTSGLVFTSDNDTSGAIDQPDESFAFWVAGDDPTAPVSFYGKTKIDSDPCIPKDSSTHFLTPYKLYGLNQSNPVVIAENVLCFEVRYFRKGRVDLNEEMWVQMCPYDSDSTLPPVDIDPTAGTTVVSGYNPETCPSPMTDNRKAEVFASPAFQDDAVNFNEVNYFSDLRDKVQRIQMGILVQKLTGKECEQAKISDPSDEACQERSVIDVRLPNRPWLFSAITGKTN